MILEDHCNKVQVVILFSLCDLSLSFNSVGSNLWLRDRHHASLSSMHF